jgi:hypothetical protein
MPLGPLIMFPPIGHMEHDYWIQLSKKGKSYLPKEILASKNYKKRWKQTMMDLK